MFKHFGERVFWWELLVLARKFFFCLMVHLPKAPEQQTMMGVMCLLPYIALVNGQRPYSASYLNTMDLVGASLATALALAGLMMFGGYQTRLTVFEVRCPQPPFTAPCPHPAFTCQPVCGPALYLATPPPVGKVSSLTAWSRIGAWGRESRGDRGMWPDIAQICTACIQAQFHPSVPLQAAVIQIVLILLLVAFLACFVVYDSIPKVKIWLRLRRQRRRVKKLKM